MIVLENIQNSLKDASGGSLPERYIILIKKINLRESITMTLTERNKIFEEYQNLIYFTVYRHKSLMEAMRMDADDLRQELAICLMKAIERYDPTLGAKPSTYFIKILRYGVLELWREHIRLKRLANIQAVPLTYTNEDGEEITLEVPYEEDYDTDILIQDFFRKLSRHERVTLGRKLDGEDPEDKRHQRYMDIIKRKALRFRMTGGGF